jgi:dipeptidyl aminopeptidase/acylaminoacyl peptidase
MFPKPAKPMKGKPTPARRNVRQRVRRFAFLLLVIALGIVYFRANVPPLVVSRFAPPDKTPIAALNRCIQARFVTMDKFFGRSRIAGPEHMRQFQPESEEEKAVVEKLEREGWKVALYLVGRGVLSSESEPSSMNIPVFITGEDQKAGLPTPSELLEPAREAFRATHWRSGYDFKIGQWFVAARPVRASQQRCLSCHHRWSNPKRWLRLGDALGVVMYVYTRDARLAMRKRHGNQVQSVAFSPDGGRLTSGHGDGTISLWETQTGTLLHRLKEHRGEIRSVAFSPDGKMLMSGDDNGMVCLWDVPTGKLLRARTFGNEVTSVVFSPDGKTIAVSGSRLSANRDQSYGYIALRDLQMEKDLRPMGFIRHCVNWVAFSPDGSSMASLSIDEINLLGRVTIWRAGLWGQSLMDTRDTVRSVAFSSDGKAVVTYGEDSRGHTKIKWWDARTGALQRMFEINVQSGYVFALSPDGKIGAVGELPNTVKLCDMQTGDIKRRLTCGDLMSAMSFSPDGKTLAIGSAGAKDGKKIVEVKLWDVQTGTLRQTLEARQEKN